MYHHNNLLSRKLLVLSLLQSPAFSFSSSLSPISDVRILRKYPFTRPVLPSLDTSARAYEASEMIPSFGTSHIYTKYY